MNACATLLAGFGLMQNSPAVIIGAMLVAMLFGPLMGIALGLAEADMPLLARSLVSEIIGAVLVLSIGYALGTASRSLSIGSEILSRTSPTVLDLLIGLVGGSAGGFTYVSTGLTGAVVAVAISTALVPPLTSCGILLARHLPGLAAGAFLLFLANFTAIAIGAMVTFWLVGHRSTAAEHRRVLVPRLISLVLLAILGFHLTNTLRRTITQATLEAQVRRTLVQEIAKFPGARLAAVTLGPPLDGAPVAWVVVRTPAIILPEQVAHLNDAVNHVAGSTVSLHVRSVMTGETTREGYVYEPPAFLNEDVQRIQ